MSVLWLEADAERQPPGFWCAKTIAHPREDRWAYLPTSGTHICSHSAPSQLGEWPDTAGTAQEAGSRLLGRIWHLLFRSGEESIRKCDKVRVKMTHALTSEREGCEKEIQELKKKDRAEKHCSTFLQCWVFGYQKMGYVYMERRIRCVWVYSQMCLLRFVCLQNNLITY